MNTDIKNGTTESVRENNAKLIWQRPVMRRFEARDAEAALNNGPDFGTFS
jgi:hypothetical protein